MARSERALWSAAGAGETRGRAGFRARDGESACPSSPSVVNPLTTCPPLTQQLRDLDDRFERLERAEALNPTLAGDWRVRSGHARVLQGEDGRAARAMHEEVDALLRRTAKSTGAQLSNLFIEVAPRLIHDGAGVDVQERPAFTIGLLNGPYDFYGETECTKAKKVGEFRGMTDALAAAYEKEFGLAGIPLIIETRAGARLDEN